jgi:hypothetical protein
MTTRPADPAAETREEPVFRTPTASMGTPPVWLDKALRLSGALEDDDLLASFDADFSRFPGVRAERPGAG